MQVLLVGYRYEYVMYGTKLKLLDCYNVFSSLSTVDGVPNGIEKALTINPTIYLSNIREVIKDKRSIITKGKTTATPNANQNKAMVDILEAFGFYSQSFEKFSTIPTIRKQQSVNDTTVRNTTIDTIKKSLYGKCYTVLYIIFLLTCFLGIEESY